MEIKDHKKSVRFTITAAIPAMVLLILMIFTGCATTAIESHQKGMETLTEKEYFIPKIPIDRHYIGCAWSKQFGPVEDSAVADIRTKKEKSFNNVQQDFAYNVGIGLGGQSLVGPGGQVGAMTGGAKKAALEGVEIISAVSLADIPFEPKTPYITEALRLANFKISQETARKAGIQVTTGAIGAALGNAGAVVGAEAQSKGGTEGDGLVVAYKLHMINPKTYETQDSGNLPLPLDKAVDFSQAKIFAKARLQIIEPGSGKSLPRNLLWSCDRANALSRDMVATWIVELRSTDPKKKSLTIAFPAHPRVDDCQNFSDVVYSRLDPVTDRIIRQKINIAIIDAELTDNLQVKTWDARISLADESFKIKQVMPDDLE
jgi:hypothetical protein